ncbi:hypothetical protein Tco_1019810 [Tanacetum coccineum]|uniref:Rubisco LSMT substrate-binding domain-containing protein n=1 Tax=Tanacetum coccineum TaxID=301880 RepID=A0ABQ5FY91_9ASTR
MCSMDYNEALCTARISILPIELNLAERARISAINLDDYQLDPLTPPPSPSSLFSMASYQRMLAETDPIQREEVLTAYGMKTGQGSMPDPEIVLTVCMRALEDKSTRVEESSLEAYLDEANYYSLDKFVRSEDRAVMLRRSTTEEEEALKKWFQSNLP